MDLDLLTELIAAFKNYQLSKALGKKTSLAEFGIWLNEQTYLTGQPESAGHKEIIGRNEIDIEIGKLVIYMNRYAKLLIRKALNDFPELVNEDFTYLYILMTCESMTKMQLIDKNIHEKPTGLEVIKRLLKYGLVAERDDEHDKRSKRVFLTEKGKATFYRSLGQMGKVSKLVSGKLTLEEKQQLYTILKKLEDFHNGLFLKQRDINIDALYDFLESGNSM